jgi:predicted nuclease with TOPRIM domain
MQKLDNFYLFFLDTNFCKWDNILHNLSVMREICMPKETTVNQLMEFLAENMATKADVRFFSDKVDNLENKFDNLENKFDNLENKFDNLENKFNNLENKFDILENKFDNLENKVDGLELKVDAGFRMVSEELGGVNQRLEKLERRTLEDSTAATIDILNLQQRVGVLERKEKIVS